MRDHLANQEKPRWPRHAAGVLGGIATVALVWAAVTPGLGWIVVGVLLVAGLFGLGYLLGCFLWELLTNA